MLRMGYAVVVCAFAFTFFTAPFPAPMRQFEHTVNLEETAETSANASIGDLDGDGDLDIVLNIVNRRI